MATDTKHKHERAAARAIAHDQPVQRGGDKK